jgi:phosphate transport system substrate-binding protein
MVKGKHEIGGAAVALVLAALLLSGCTSKPTDEEKAQKITVSGSTTVLPIAQAAAEAYMKNHTKADITVSGGGSGVGITAIGQGTVDIGMSSRELKSTEISQYPDLVVTTVAKDALVMIVNPGNGLNSISLTTVKGIYNGTIKNWKDIGGADLAIVLVGRDSASGTRSYFQEFVMKNENSTSSMLEKNSNGAVKETVAQTPGAIGYVGLGYTTGGVKALKLDVNGTLVDGSAATVLNKTYPASRDLFMITKGPAKGLAKAYIDYILSPAGQKIVSQQDFVPLK